MICFFLRKLNKENFEYANLSNDMLAHLCMPCKKNYVTMQYNHVNMQHNNVTLRFIYVNMRLIHSDIQHCYIEMWHTLAEQIPNDKISTNVEVSLVDFFRLTSQKIKIHYYIILRINLLLYIIFQKSFLSLFSPKLQVLFKCFKHFYFIKLNVTYIPVWCYWNLGHIHVILL